MFQLLAIISAFGLFEFAAIRHGVDSRNLIGDRNLRD